MMRIPAVRIALMGMALLMSAGIAGSQENGEAEKLRSALKGYRHKVVNESNRSGNWELYLANADGSDPVNLTKTPDVQEVYAKASPDGTRIAYCGDVGEGDAKVRNLYVINVDGTGRKKIAARAREHCWSADGTKVAYLRDEKEKFSYGDALTKGIFIYDLESGKTRAHPNNDKIEHLYTLNWAPNGKWFVATIHGGMGFKHAIVAVEAEGDRVVDLKLRGCRPDLNFDGSKVCWVHGDQAVGVADMDWSGPEPRATRIRNVMQVKKPLETYHPDWSPDGKYIAFSYGPKIKRKNLRRLLAEFPGVDAPGWNICVADASKENVFFFLTTGGKSNKEAEWVPVRTPSGQ